MNRAVGPCDARWMDALNSLKRLLDPGILLSQDEDLTAYEEAPNNMRGHARGVLRPRTLDDVREILRTCRDHRVNLVPQGANSGLVGGGIPDRSGEQVVLSTDRLKERFELDEAGRTLTVSAGWTLHEINERLAGTGLRLPIEVGSNPSVGGMVSTNIAGSNVLRYGDARRRILGVQVVVPDRDLTVFDELAPLRKRNEGLKISHLFIGTEGRYGVCSAATLDLATVPRTRATAWLAISQPDALLTVLRHFEDMAGEWLSTFELASSSAVRLLAADHEAMMERVPGGEGDRVLVEIGAANGDAEPILMEALEVVTGLGLVNDAVVGPPEKLWEVRHTIPLITERLNDVSSFDISTPRSLLPALRRRLTEVLEEADPDLQAVELGHIGDGGLHFIVPHSAALIGDMPAIKRLRSTVFDCVVKDFRGSFSAEHGVGTKNLDAYEKFVPRQVRDVSELLKARFDPFSILASGRDDEAGTQVSSSAPARH